jgi:type I restriction enzyme S subunit
MTSTKRINIVNLGDVVDFEGGGTPSKANAAYWGGDIPWASVKDISGPELSSTIDYITEEGLANSASRIVPAGNVILPTRMALGRAAINTVDVAINQDLRVAYPHQNLDRRYLLWFIISNARLFESLGSGATVKGITLDKLRDLQIPLPPLAEQKRIAAILDKADAICRKLQQSLRLSDDFLRSVFLDMFGDPVTNPKGWDNSSVLGEVAEIVSGVTKGRNLDGKKTREIPYLAVANVQDKRLNLVAVKAIPATNEEIQKYRLVKNDLLLTEGGDPDKLGRGTLWNDELAECIHQNHIFRVRLTHPEIHPVFLNWLVGSERGKKYFLRSAKQTTGIASINMTQLRAFPMLIPPFLVQKQFAALIQAVAKKTMKLTLQARTAEELFSSLRQRAFRCKI